MAHGMRLIYARQFSFMQRGLSVSATALAPSGVSFTHLAKMLHNRQWAVEARGKGCNRGAVDDNRQAEWRRVEPIGADVNRHEATRMLHLMLDEQRLIRVCRFVQSGRSSAELIVVSQVEVERSREVSSRQTGSKDNFAIAATALILLRRRIELRGEPLKRLTVTCV